MINPSERAKIILHKAMATVAHDESNPYEAVVPPLVQTSLFTFENIAAMDDAFSGRVSRAIYSRGLNPTVRHLEETLAALEETEDALALASGMAAISSAILTFVKPGDRIVSVKHVYPDAYRFLETFVRRFGIEVSYVDGLDLDAVAQALPGAALFYLESPTSWTMEAHDVGALAALARQHGVISAIDNSWATPVFQQPHTLGVDLVIHSASKYISGHSDVVAGIVAGSKEMINKIRSTTHPYLGGKIAPFDAWLLIRGLRTLPLRLQAHQESALEIARRLNALPEVTKVLHPGLAPLPSGLYGTSGLFSFIFHDDIDINVFCDRLKYFKIGVSWGGHESLIMPSGVVLIQAAQPNSARDFGVSPRMIRVHIGLEGTENLWQDIEQALESVRKTS